MVNAFGQDNLVRNDLLNILIKSSLPIKLVKQNLLKRIEESMKSNELSEARSYYDPFEEIIEYWQETGSEK